MQEIISVEALARNLSILKTVSHFTEDALDSFVCARAWTHEELDQLDDILRMIELLETFSTESANILKG